MKVLRILERKSHCDFHHSLPMNFLYTLDLYSQEKYGLSRGVELASAHTSAQSKPGETPGRRATGLMDALSNVRRAARGKIL